MNKKASEAPTSDELSGLEADREPAGAHMIILIASRWFALVCWGVVFGAHGAGLGDPLIFSGMCDASAAVALDQDLFAVANDEDDVLRFYRRSQPGKPVYRHDLTPLLSGGRKKSEADIEGAARLGGKVFMITSHGRNAAGQSAPQRHRLFALEITQRNGKVSVTPVGHPYTNLVADLDRDPRLAKFRLADAATRAPKSSGGLNIEALTETPEGTLLIGFRSPVPERRALLVPLLNPDELMAGRAPRFGDPLLLDLGGLGLRGVGSTAQGYYLLAGAVDDEAESRLFFWERRRLSAATGHRNAIPGYQPGRRLLS